VDRPGGRDRRGQDPASRDHLRANVSLYWFTNTAGPAANLYSETFHDPGAWAPTPRGTVPTGVAVSLASDVTVRRLAERDHHVVHSTAFERGGHFASLEVPDRFVEDVRTFFRGRR
jgi:pimeloyl-ACP methyl ester carboxylesterase